MKFIIITLVAAGLLVFGGLRRGLVTFHYPNIIQNEPLKNPQKVVRLDGPDIILENGRMVRLDFMYVSEISNELSQAAFIIDLEGEKEGAVRIWGRQPGWICGTAWSQPIRIPLIRDTVYVNRRELIAVGAYVKAGQSYSPAIHRLPFRAETERVPEAASPFE